MLQWFKNFDSKYFATPRQKLMFFLAYLALSCLAGAIHSYFIKGTVLETWIEKARQVGVWIVVLFVLWAIFDRFIRGTWDLKNVGKIAIVIVGGIIAVPVFIVVFCTLIPLIVTGHL